MLAKIKRFLTCLLPVSKDRHGQCKRCGACCQLPNRCPFYRRDAEGNSLCAIYLFRPPSCRKYPRTASELLTADTCGFRFAEASNPGKRQGS